MIMILEDTSMSCGVRQIDGLLNKPKDNLMQIAKALYVHRESAAFIQWSDVWGRNKKGNRLYHYIKRNFPKSSVQRTKTAKNPNSGNTICVYTWKVPRNLKKWYTKASGRGKCKFDTKNYNDEYCKVHKTYDCFDFGY